jgi:hypothetical protein
MSEILRPYPPAYITAREAIEPCQIGGYEFLPGTTILFSQWVAHRELRYFDDPDTFRPERWIEGLANRLTLPGAKQLPLEKNTTAHEPPTIVQPFLTLFSRITASMLDRHDIVTGRQPTRDRAFRTCSISAGSPEISL